MLSTKGVIMTLLIDSGSRELAATLADVAEVFSDAVNEDGASIGPKMLDPLTLSPSEHAVGVISFDVELTRNPQLMHVEGSFVTDAVIVSLGR